MNSVHPNLCFAGTIFWMQAYSSLGLRGFEPIETMSACFNWLQNVLKGRASLPCLMQCWANSNLCLEILLTLFHNHSVIYTGVYLSIFERNLYTKDVHCIIVNTLYSLSHFEMRRCKSRFWGLSKKHPKVEHGSCPEHELWPFSKEPCLVRTWSPWGILSCSLLKQTKRNSKAEKGNHWPGIAFWRFVNRESPA